jgi:hypothetical protein
MNSEVAYMKSLKTKLGLATVGLTSLISSCIIYPQYTDDIYAQKEKKENIETILESKETTTKYVNPFEYSAYPSSWGWDFDGDGIMNRFDPWSMQHGPFLDRDGNGVPTYGDWQVGGFSSNYVDNYLFWSNSYWSSGMNLLFWMDSPHFHYYNTGYRNNHQVVWMQPSNPREGGRPGHTIILGKQDNQRTNNENTRISDNNNRTNNTIKTENNNRTNTNNRINSTNNNRTSDYNKTENNNRTSNTNRTYIPRQENNTRTYTPQNNRTYTPQNNRTEIKSYTPRQNTQQNNYPPRNNTNTNNSGRRK